MYASNLCNEIGTCYQYKLVVSCTWRKSTSFVFSYDFPNILRTQQLLEVDTVSSRVLF